MKSLRVSLAICVLTLLLIVPSLAIGQKELPSVIDNHRKVNEYWTFRSLAYEPHILAEFRNKAVFVYVWASWSQVCIKEMPEIKELYTKLSGQVSFIFLSADENMDRLKDFLDDIGYRGLPVYVLDNTDDGDLPRGMTVNSFPTTFLISEDMTLVSRIVGAHDWNSQESIEEILRLTKSRRNGE